MEIPNNRETITKLVSLVCLLGFMSFLGVFWHMIRAIFLGLVFPHIMAAKHAIEKVCAAGENQKRSSSQEKMGLCYKWAFRAGIASSLGLITAKACLESYVFKADKSGHHITEPSLPPDPFSLFAICWGVASFFILFYPILRLRGIGEGERKLLDDWEAQSSLARFAAPLRRLMVPGQWSGVREEKIAVVESQDEGDGDDEEGIRRQLEDEASARDPQDGAATA